MIAIPATRPVRVALASGVVALALGLFCLQFALLGLVPVTGFGGPIGTSSRPAVQVLTALHVAPLVLAVIPAAAVACVLSRSFSAALLPRLQPPGRAKALLAVWVVTWCTSSLPLHVALGGSDPSRWSAAYLVQPSIWYSLVACAAGLFLGARRGGVAQVLPGRSAGAARHEDAGSHSRSAGFHRRHRRGVSRLAGSI